MSSSHRIAMTEIVQELAIYGIMGALCFGIGLIAGYIAVSKYYEHRFITVSRQCSEKDSLTPLLDELCRES